jgi:MFS family permease
MRTSPGSPGRVARLGARLASAEARLVGAELRRTARWSALAMGLVAFAAAVGMAAGACLVAAVVLGLATAMPAWLAALITGVALLVLAGFLALLAREAARDGAGALRQTTERAREEGRWMATLISSNER